MAERESPSRQDAKAIEPTSADDAMACQIVDAELAAPRPSVEGIFNEIDISLISWFHIQSC
jgi:hypothetical protein